MNLYQYVGSNPVGWVDPLGLAKGRVVGWVTKRVNGRLIKVSAVYTEKQAAKLFAKGSDILVRDGYQQAMKVAGLIIPRNRLLRHRGGHYLHRSGKWGLPHVQDAAIANRHIFYGLMAVVMLNATSAQATIDNPECTIDIDMTSVWTDPYPGKSIGHALTVTRWVGEDSWWGTLDWINPGQLIAIGGDIGRSMDREFGKSLIGVSATIRKSGEPWMTFSFDANGNLVSVASWSGGEMGDPQSGDDYLDLLDTQNPADTFMPEIIRYLNKNGFTLSEE